MLTAVVMLVGVVSGGVSIALDRRYGRTVPVAFFPLVGVVVSMCVMLGVVFTLRAVGYDLPVFHKAVWASEVRN